MNATAQIIAKRRIVDEIVPIVDLGDLADDELHFEPLVNTKSCSFLNREFPCCGVLTRRRS